MKIKFNFNSLRHVCLMIVMALGLFTLLATGGGGGNGGSNDSDDHLIIDVEVEDNECNYGVGMDCGSAEGWLCEPNSGNPGNFSILNGKLVFVATVGCKNESQQTIFELDNTGDIKDVGSFSAYFYQFININNNIYFFYSDIPMVGSGLINLYKYDGDEVLPVQTYPTGEEGISSLRALMAYNNKLYYIYNTDLYSYDGANPPIIVGNAGSSFVRGYIVYNDRLYFIIGSSSTSSRLWCYDENANLLSLTSDDIIPYADGIFVIFQDKLFYVASDDINGQQLWVIDKDNPPVMVTSFPNPTSTVFIGIGQFVYPLAVINEKLLFAVFDETASSSPYLTYPNKLWEYDGVNLNPIDFEHLIIPGGIVLNDHSYFVAFDFDSSLIEQYQQYQLWGYDGINPPFKIDTGINPPSSIYTANDKLLYQKSETIYSYDSTSEPTVFAELENSALTTISSIQYFNDNYYVAGYDYNYISSRGSKKYYYGNELWKIDSVGNISIFKDFYPGISCWCE